MVWHTNCKEDGKRPLSIGKSKKVIGFFKDELEGKDYERILWT